MASELKVGGQAVFAGSGERGVKWLDHCLWRNGVFEPFLTRCMHDSELDTECEYRMILPKHKQGTH